MTTEKMIPLSCPFCAIATSEVDWWVHLAVVHKVSNAKTMIELIDLKKEAIPSPIEQKIKDRIKDYELNIVLSSQSFAPFVVKELRKLLQE